MITINSLSGGRTSGYIGANYKADYNLFSIVCVDDPKCAHKDKFFMDYANEKVSKYCGEYGEILGTAEDPIIFETMYKMEQLIGSEIIWLRSESFDKLIERKKGLPGKEQGGLGRFCTTFLKIAPAFDFWYKYLGPEIIGVNLGFRFDEQERKEQFTTTWDFPISCNTYGLHRQNWIKGLVWRQGLFPLIDDGIFHKHILDFWLDKNIPFAKDSNCQFCIYKKEQQVGYNNITCPDQINWAKGRELLTGYQWHKSYSIESSQQVQLSDDFIQGGGAGCQAGECIS